VPAKVVPDNLKVGVTHASYYDPVINASYAALIKYYGTAVVPARSRKRGTSRGSKMPFCRPVVGFWLRCAIGNSSR
jgi:hypothetical protein